MRGCNLVLEGVDLDIEERRPSTEEHNGRAKDVDHKRWLSPSSHIEDLATSAGQLPDAHDSARDDQRAEDDISYDPGCLCKPNLWLKLMEHYWVDGTAKTTSGSGESHGNEELLLIEPCADNRQRRYKEATHSKTHADGL